MIEEEVRAAMSVTCFYCPVCKVVSRSLLTLPLAVLIFRVRLCSGYLEQIPSADYEHARSLAIITAYGI